MLDIRQRGIGNPNPVKLGRCIKELERSYGVREGSAGQAEPKVSDGNTISQSDIADMIGISVDTLSNYKKLTELVPELQDWVETEARKPINKGFRKLKMWIKHEFYIISELCDKMIKWTLKIEYW